jgi:hypothetical protein
LATTSSSETGPTWCPPIAMYHCWPGIDSILRVSFHRRADRRGVAAKDKAYESE